MRAAAIAALIAAAMAGMASAQNLSGLRVGDDISAVQRLGMDPAAVNRSGPTTAMRWDLPDGNSLSVSADSSGRIVYVETDWGRGVSGRLSDIPGFMYGETTLDDIRFTMGSNGYCHQASCFQQIERGVVALNTYGIAGTQAAITFVTFLSADAFASGARPGQAKLDAIILGDRAYLDAIWGSGRAIDPDYREVAFR